MKKLYFITLFIPAFLFAQIPAGYYNSAQNLTGNNLKVALYNIIKNHTVIAYGGLWGAFSKADKKANGKVWDIYSYKPVGAQPYEYTFVTDQCGSYNSEADCFNREHTWPQSWFNSTSGPDSDLFHIYPSDGHVNGQRSNFPYGNVSSASFTSLNGSKLGTCSNPGYSSTVFEPIDEFKGDLARGYFYMTTRYYSEDAAWSTSPATNKATILTWQLNVLMQWHHQDPVSAKEIARNDSIYYKYQNNRNPFIDHPNWADSIWATSTEIQELNSDPKNLFSVFPNPSSNAFTIIYHNNAEAQLNYTITNIAGAVMDKQTVMVNDHFTVDAGELNSGVYFITIQSDKGYAHLKLIKQ